MEGLARGVSAAEPLGHLRQVIGRMKDGSCDAAVLGCTEFPLIRDNSSPPLPTLD
jgi:aspartate racemase